MPACGGRRCRPRPSPRCRAIGLEVDGDAEPRRRAAAVTSGSRASSAEPRPHHETTTVWTPAAAISRICARTIVASSTSTSPGRIEARREVARRLRAMLSSAASARRARGCRTRVVEDRDRTPVARVAGPVEGSPGDRGQHERRRSTEQSTDQPHRRRNLSHSPAGKQGFGRLRQLFRGEFRAECGSSPCASSRCAGRAPARPLPFRAAPRA